MKKMFLMAAFAAFAFAANAQTQATASTNDAVKEVLRRQLHVLHPDRLRKKYIASAIRARTVLRVVFLDRPNMLQLGNRKQPRR